MQSYVQIVCNPIILRTIQNNHIATEYKAPPFDKGRGQRGGNADMDRNKKTVEILDRFCFCGS